MLYMFLADGFEETEAIGALDVIRRADIDIQTVGVGAKTVCGSHGVKVEADITADEIDYEKIDGVILPGGMPGTVNLQNSSEVIRVVKYCAENDKIVAAICAAPMILGQLELLRGKHATCFPGYEKDLIGAEATGEYAVSDGKFITGRGAGAAMLFGAKIVDAIKPGQGVEILKQMQHPLNGQDR